MIRILKASAGSGKTWNLALQYIRLLLEADDNVAYRHILAVTFTNKATDEMKERILEKLHELAVRPEESDYLEHLVPSVCPDLKSLKKAAEGLLRNLLHDYGAFSVSTIDHFFQQTLKAFAREVGQFSSYSIELDRKSLLRESVDSFLDSLTDTSEHSAVLEWMTRKTMSQLESGDGYRLDHTLYNIADRFNSEEYRRALEDAGIDEYLLYSDESLDRLQKGCDDVVGSFSISVKAAADAIAAAFDDAGMDMADTYSKFMLNNVRKFRDLTPEMYVPSPTPAFRERAMKLNGSVWYNKKNQHLEDMVTSSMEEAVCRFFETYDSGCRVYNTALALRSQVYGFAVANDLYRHYTEMLKDNNIMTIDQANDMLRKIIDGTDTPFIYEKTGVRYEHFLLDEFQDTSLVQWDNFRPLLENSVAQGFDNLIVGDVKQSIYRWRQSDWSLLEHQVHDAFRDATRSDTLDTNYRSCRNIVSFNNSYFMNAAAYLDQRYGREDNTVSSIYSDVGQKAVNSDEGMVEVRFCNPERHFQEIMDAVRRAEDAGYGLGDITVLVRGNQEGSEIAEFLIANGVNVLSDDSLKVASSLTVRRLVSLLAGIENPGDRMSGFLAESLGVHIPTSHHSLIDLCESLLRGLEKADPETFAAEMLYIQSFMDMVQDFINTQGNSLRHFLKKWSEDKTSISSPKSDNAVRIMTVHKSKGLDFPYVIFPSLASVGFYRHGNKWAKPEVEGTGLEDAAPGVYDVHLSAKSRDTLFEKEYDNEVLLQHVDNINVLYVAFTRAAKAMSIISPMPEGVTVSDGTFVMESDDYEDFSRWTLAYMMDVGRKEGFDMEECVDDGEIVFRKGGFPALSEKKAPDAEAMPSRFVSYPLNPETEDQTEDVRERGRLKFSADAVDFFEDGNGKVSASNRIKGVVLHDIMSRVVCATDLENAVNEAIFLGEISADDADETVALLKKGIESVKERNWFPEDGSQVLNEVELIDSDGAVYRPDRVVISGGKVQVIDFKFGEHHLKYSRQVRRYGDIWRRMGYDDVSAFLWYVQTGEVMQIL